MSNVVPFQRPARADPIERAWEAYDEAAKGLSEVYRRGEGTSQSRMEQALEVAQLWRDFLRVQGI